MDHWLITSRHLFAQGILSFYYPKSNSVFDDVIVEFNRPSASGPSTPLFSSKAENGTVSFSALCRSSASLSFKSAISLPSSSSAAAQRVKMAAAAKAFCSYPSLQGPSPALLCSAPIQVGHKIRINHGLRRTV